MTHSARPRSFATSGSQEELGGTKAAYPKVIFSGIQPTSIPHIGNYFGAIRQWVNLQESISTPSANASTPPPPPQHPLIVSIVDLHAITLPKQPKLLKYYLVHFVVVVVIFEIYLSNFNIQNNSDYIYKCAATLLACGIDPERTILYQQSQVPYHGQLGWILGCQMTVPQLARMNQFKHKTADSGLADSPLGLFTYPMLQAADILLFRATHVPVGEDQLQHIELTRDIAAKFNNFYGTRFMPSPVAIEST